MKNLLIFVFAIAFIAPSCKKSSSTTSYMNTGTIKGPSPFMTSCGGAYWIVIDGVAARTTFNTLPTSSGIDLSTATFPISVKLNWHYVTPNTCAIIVVDDIVKTD